MVLPCQMVNKALTQGFGIAALLQILIFKTPFSIKKVKIIIADYISNQLEKIFNNFYAHVWSIRIDELQVFFCEDNYEIKLEQLLTTLSDDLGENVKIHEGIYVKKVE